MIKMVIAIGILYFANLSLIAYGRPDYLMAPGDPEIATAQFFSDLIVSLIAAALQFGLVYFAIPKNEPEKEN